MNTTLLENLIFAVVFLALGIVAAVFLFDDPCLWRLFLMAACMIVAAVFLFDKEYMNESVFDWFMKMMNEKIRRG